MLTLVCIHTLVCTLFFVNSPHVEKLGQNSTVPSFTTISQINICGGRKFALRAQ
ncbi:hypothetical protein Sbal223_4465 (plasmid) [Shewanella baltica OS223]|nr:hypothetical protein Sbal223_4465 [Shewanella baltica OS223]